jgi:adenylylsulfate kinase-like enzyme
VSKSNFSNGKVIWITGVSGSGKSTLATEVVDNLRASSHAVILLDGDELREVLGLEVDCKSSYERKDRIKLAWQYTKICRLLARQGFTVVIATISLFREIHIWNRVNLPGYFEVVLNVSIDELISRDPKGIYKGYFSGSLTNVVGLDLPVDIPESPDCVFEFDPEQTVREVAVKLIQQLNSRKKIL